jgi:hypothetical protein
MDPRERPWGDEDFGTEREQWREPMELDPRSGRLQWGGESLDRGYFPRRQSIGREASYPRRSWREPQREWWREESPSDRSFTERARQGGYGSRFAHDAQGPFYGKGPKGYRRSDQRILEDVCEALHDCGALDASDIEVTAQSGEVVLKGSVSDRRGKRMAEEIAEEQPGVRDVRNELRIASSPTSSSSSSSQGSMRGQH